jgi:hypothetical protein
MIDIRNVKIILLTLYIIQFISINLINLICANIYLIIFVPERQNIAMNNWANKPEKKRSFFQHFHWQAGRCLSVLFLRGFLI